VAVVSHIHQEVRVAAPIEHVFELACQVERQVEWNPYMELKNVSGPIDMAGTTFDSTMKLLGQQITSKGTIVEAERPRLIHIRGVADNGATSDWVYRFEPAGDGTQCTLDIEYEVQGTVAGVMDRLVYHAALDRATRHMAENFAALVDMKTPTTA
jgi:carbon monoxide dehydrogenase subunit G